jgi:hypothetical protein
MLKNTLVDDWSQEVDNPIFRDLTIQAAKAGLQFEVIDVFTSHKSPDFCN